jgi:hypothetical protein
MSSRLIEIFEDEKLVEKIKRRLPYLFQLAELESSRAGKTGMEVGSVRERIIVALLIYKFGEANVETQIPITEPEVDANYLANHSLLKRLQVKALVGSNLYGQLMLKRQKNFVRTIIHIAIFCLFRLTRMTPEVSITFL